jgi:hypothetical protein
MYDVLLTVAVIAYLLLCVIVGAMAVHHGQSKPTPKRSKQAQAVAVAEAPTSVLDMQVADTALIRTFSLPCRECGSRAVPPVPFVDSPEMTWDQAIVFYLGQMGHVITATCAACGHPLTSRRMNDEETAAALTLGAVDGLQLEAAWAEQLATY